MNVGYPWGLIEITEHGIYSSWRRSVEIWATKSATNFGAQITLVSFQHLNIFESLGIWFEIEHPVDFLAARSTYLTSVPGCVIEPSQIDEGNPLPQNSKLQSFGVGMSRTPKIIPWGSIVSSRFHFQIYWEGTLPVDFLPMENNPMDLPWTSRFLVTSESKFRPYMPTSRYPDWLLITNLHQICSTDPKLPELGAMML